MSNQLGPYQLNQIYTGDTKELAPALPDGCAKLVFADPPYWVNFKYANGETDAQMAYIDPVWLAEEMQRIAQVALITPSIGWMYRYPQPRWTIAWHKPAAMGRNGTGGANNWEPILMYGSGRIDIDVFTAPIQPDKMAAFHTCPKPLKLMQQIVERFTEPGDTVIDLLCGSGTTCVAAKMLGRNYLGFEIDPVIAEHTRNRLENTQPPLLTVAKSEQMALV